MEGEMERTVKEIVVASYKVQSQHSPVRNESSHD
jgi:hypothetical protein